VIVEVIAVGTELLLGQIVNSNVAVIGRRLAEEGFDAHFQVTVGDNLARLTDTIRTAVLRSDAVILTGGIGPTQDDLTREAICEVAGRRMVRNEEYANVIRERIMAARGVMPENNLRQADHPEGAEQLPNANGMALGISLEHEGTWLFAVPGVPSEMRVMIEDQVLPRLRRAAGEPTVLVSRVLKTWGWGESQVAETLDDLFGSTNPSVAFLIDGMEVQVRITAKAENVDLVESLIAPVETEVRSRLGTTVFAQGEETIESILIELLSARAWRLGTAEGVTLGRVGARLAAAPGGAAVFQGALAIPAFLASGPLQLDSRPVSAEVAVAMADRAASLHGAEVAISVTDAHPYDHQGDPARTVYIGVHTPSGTRARSFRLLGEGERFRSFAITAALHTARQAITDEWREASTNSPWSWQW